jgi:signal transduction histidine kinase
MLLVTLTSTTVKCIVKRLDLTTTGIDTMDNRELEVKLLLIQDKLDALANKFATIEAQLNDNIDEVKQIINDLAWKNRFED